MSLDKLFILGGRQLKTLIPEWYTPFWTLNKCAEGKCSSEQSLVLIECNTEMDLNILYSELQRVIRKVCTVSIGEECLIF